MPPYCSILAHAQTNCLPVMPTTLLNNYSHHLFSRHHTATLIDNMFTNNVDQLDDSINGIIFSHISDHLPIVRMFNTNMFTAKNTTENANDGIYQRLFNKTNAEAFKNAIKTLCWNTILDEKNDPERAYNEFLEMFTDAYEANFPLKRKKNKTKINKTKSPWMTNCILKSVRNKNKLYKTFLMNRNSKNEQLYKKYKNKLNHIIKMAKKTYYEDQLIKYKQNSRMMCKTLNGLLNKPKNTRSSNIIDDPKRIANNFNDYFINVGLNLANRIKHSEKK